jgi:hypothetical protein
MKPKELGKYYVVVFCKGCGAGYRVKDDPVPQESKITISTPQSLTCPGCRFRAEYLPAEIRVARFQKEGLGRRKRKAT